MAVPDKSEFARTCIGPRLKRLADLEATRVNSFEALNACCVELRKTDPKWGLLEKKGGARVRNRAADILAYDLGNGTCQLLDVIGDAEGEDGVPRVGWGEVADEDHGKRPIEQWKEPYTDVPVPPPPPPPPPPPTEPPPDEAILRRLEALERDITQLRVQAVEAMEMAASAEAKALVAQGVADEARHRKLKVIGDPDGKDVIDTSSRFGHSHQLRLKVIDG